MINPANTFRIFGNSRISFQFDPNESIRFNETTTIKFSVTKLSTSSEVPKVGLCFYREYENAEAPIYCIGLFGQNIASGYSNVITARNHVSLHGSNVNVAYQKSASQSSTPLNGGFANLAVDGIVGNQRFSLEDWEINSVSQTNSTVNPWWEVDLEEDAIIRKVVIYKRLDYLSDDLSNFNLTIFDANDSIIYTENDFLEYTMDEKKIEVFLDNVLGRKVRVSLNGAEPRVLSLSEVQVFGNIYNFDIPIGQIFRFSDDEINRLAIIQDYEIVETESCLIQNMTIYEVDSVPLVSCLMYLLLFHLLI